MKKINMADTINNELRELQQKWYSQLKDKYKNYNNFSSPFCFGVSSFELDKSMIMYVGEEARDWWFDDGKQHESDIDYLQGYAISYFERQLHENSKNKSVYAKDYPSAFEKPNTSKFWKYIKAIKNETSLPICWNNLDKLHRIKAVNGKRKTIALTCKQEEELHNICPKNEASLLLNEINVVQPKIVILTKYIHSISKALGIDENQLLKIKKHAENNGAVVVDISHLCKEKDVFLRKDTCALLLINHPNCRKKGFFEKAVNQTVEAINNSQKD